MQLHSFQQRRHRLGGFSLIEVLVATTVLLIIVLIVAMVFQQSSGAWAGGTRKANAAMTLRSVLGQMQREMIEAVDAREFSNSCANTFTVDSADFVTLLGDPANAMTGPRVPYHIKYEYDGRFIARTSHKLLYADTHWQVDTSNSNTLSILNRNQPLSFFEINVVPAADPAMLPLRIDIEARVSNTNKALIVSGRSAGRDKTLGTTDDILASK